MVQEVIEKTEEIKEKIDNSEIPAIVETVEESTALAKETGSNPVSTGFAVLVGCLSLLGVVKIIDVVKKLIGKIKDKVNKRKSEKLKEDAQKHPENYVNEDDLDGELVEEDEEVHSEEDEKDQNKGKK